MSSAINNNHEGQHELKSCSMEVGLNAYLCDSEAWRGHFGCLLGSRVCVLPNESGSDFGAGQLEGLLSDLVDESTVAVNAPAQAQRLVRSQLAMCSLYLM